MSVFDVLEKLNALDFKQLSLQERQSGEAEIRQLLDKFSTSGSKDPDILSKKIALLKIWQKFDQLKIEDEQDREALRESQKKTKRLAKLENTQKIMELNIPQPQYEALAGLEPHSVSIKINEDVEVDGLEFQHGTVVDVPEHSAAKLIATEKTQIV